MQPAEKLSYSALQKGWTVYRTIVSICCKSFQRRRSILFVQEPRRVDVSKSCEPALQPSETLSINYQYFSILSIHSFNRVWEIIWNKHERRCENQLMKLRILVKNTWNGHEVSTLNIEECHNKRWGYTRLQQLRTTVVGISWSAEPARIRRGQSFLCPWWPNYAPLLLTSPRLLILCCGRAHALRLHSYTALSATSSLTNCCLTLIQHNEPRALRAW